MERAEKNNNRIERRNRHITISSFSQEKLGIEQSRSAEVICMSNKAFLSTSGPQIASNSLNPFIPKKKALRPTQSAQAVSNPEFIVWESRLFTTQYVYIELKLMYLLKGLIICHHSKHHLSFPSKQVWYLA